MPAITLTDDSTFVNRALMIQFPQGIVGRALRTTNATATTATSQATAQKVLQLDVPLQAGRLYRFSSLPQIYASINNAVVVPLLVYTVDGSTPAVSGTTLVQGALSIPVAGYSNAASLTVTYTPSST